jgi:hypothetical protein
LGDGLYEQVDGKGKPKRIVEKRTDRFGETQTVHRFKEGERQLNS